MKKIFFSYFVFTLLSLVVVLFAYNPAIDILINHYFKKQITEYVQSLTHGTFFLITKNIKDHPREKWPERIASLQKEFGYPVILSDIKNQDLPVDALKQLNSGEILTLENHTLFKKRIDKSDFVLTIGPILEELPSGTDQLAIEAVIYSTLIITLGLLSLLWALPFSRNLKRIKSAAVSFGQGNLEIRARVSPRSSLTILAGAFNSMADRIEQLVRSHKELTNSVSHELRTPVARIKFSMEMLKTTANDKDRERYLSEIDTDIDELESLVGEILTHARFDRETFESDLEPQAIVPWLNNIVEKEKPTDGSVIFNCRINLNRSDFRVRFEPKHLGRAINNLLRNAKRYAKSWVNITLEVVNQDCLIHVDDDGPGIPEAQWKKVFEPFVRLDSSRERSSGGYGLGLSIVHRIVQWHNGQISVSDSPTGGARFTIRWPGLKPEEE